MMGTIRLSAQQYAAADQSATAALAVSGTDVVGDYQNPIVTYGPNAAFPFDDTGETPSLQPGAD